MHPIRTATNGTYYFEISSPELLVVRGLHAPTDKREVWLRAKVPYDGTVVGPFKSREDAQQAQEEINRKYEKFLALEYLSRLMPRPTIKDAPTYRNIVQITDTDLVDGVRHERMERDFLYDDVNAYIISSEGDDDTLRVMLQSYDGLSAEWRLDKPWEFIDTEKFSYDFLVPFCEMADVDQRRQYLETWYTINVERLWFDFNDKEVTVYVKFKGLNAEFSGTRTLSQEELEELFENPQKGT